MLAEMDTWLTLVDHARAREIEADHGEHPRQREDSEDDCDGDSDRIAPRVAPAASPRSEGEHEGERDTERGHGVDPLRVEVGLVDDSRDDDHCAERDSEHAEASASPSVARRAPRSAIAASAAGKFRKTSARLNPPARPAVLTWYRSLGSIREYVITSITAQPASSAQTT